MPIFDTRDDSALPLDFDVNTMSADRIRIYGRGGAIEANSGAFEWTDDDLTYSTVEGLPL